MGYKRNVSIKGHYRTRGGRSFAVGPFIRRIKKGKTSSITPEPTSYNYNNIRDMLDSPDTTEWTPTRVLPMKEPFFERLFKRDYAYTSTSQSDESREQVGGCFRKIFVRVGVNGEGTMTVDHKYLTDPENPKKKFRPVKVKIGPYADLTKLGEREKGRFFGSPPITVDLNGVNLKGCKAGSVSWGGFVLKNSNLEGVDFESANLTGTDLSGCVLRNANLSNANLRGANLSEADLSNVDLSSANLVRADLSGVNWRGVKMDSTVLFERSEGDDRLAKPTYDQYSFYDAAKEMGLTHSQMEFIISSKAVEVRDNRTGIVVDRDFNPFHHHVVPWAVQNWVPLEKQK